MLPVGGRPRAPHGQDAGQTWYTVDQSDRNSSKTDTFHKPQLTNHTFRQVIFDK